MFFHTKSSTQSDLKEDVRILTSEELKKYFHRIGADDKAIKGFQSEPTLETLCEIHRLQTTHVHISNYDMHDESKMKEPHPISPVFNDIFNKIVIQHKHGYCFENNQLLRHVLISLGFKVKFYNSHIIRNDIPNKEPQHVVMVVTIDKNNYLVDAGYGGVAPIAVTAMDLQKEQIDKHWQTTQPSGNKYKFTQQEFKFDGKQVEKGFVFSHLYVKPDTHEGAWKPLYIFSTTVTCSFDEFASANYQVSKDPDKTPFKQTLFETAFLDGKTRISLTQNELQITKAGQLTLWKPVKNEEKYKKYLVKYLGHTQDQAKKLGKVHDRVIFGNASAACLLWHESYKKRKKESTIKKENTATLVFSV